MAKEKITTIDIKNALLRRHERDFCMFEVTTGGSLIGRMDCVAMKLSWAKPRLDAYEIKSSRRDFLNDDKWMNYLPYCNYFSFICPHGLIEKEELSEGVGLYWVAGKSHRIIQKKKPVYREDVDPTIYKRIIMSKLKTDRYPFHNDKADYFRDWLEHKKSNRDLGYEVSTRLVQEVSELSNKVRLSEQNGKKIEGIREILHKSGYNTYYIEEAVRQAVEDSKGCKWSKSLVNNLQNVVNVAQNIIDEVEKEEEPK